MKTTILSTIFLTLIIIGTVQASAPTFEGSLDCSFTKNNSEDLLLIASIGEDFEEEATEIYFGSNGEVEAEVLYLPFQYGIVVSLKTKNGLVTSEGESSAEVSLSYKNDSYTLECSE
ncbi:MAG: hypothetical protein ACJAT2_000536 [Bacteriovoracaceae bacterium]|jgi:hypothetical protein